VGGSDGVDAGEHGCVVVEERAVPIPDDVCWGRLERYGAVVEQRSMWGLDCDPPWKGDAGWEK